MGPLAVCTFGLDVFACAEVCALGRMLAFAAASRMWTSALCALKGLGVRYSRTRLSNVAKGLALITLRGRGNVASDVAHFAVDRYA